MSELSMKIGWNSIKEKRLDEERIQKMNTQTDTRQGHSRVVNRGNHRGNREVISWRKWRAERSKRRRDGKGEQENRRERKRILLEVATALDMQISGHIWYAAGGYLEQGRRGWAVRTRRRWIWLWWWGEGGHETLKVRDRTGNTGSGERASRHDIG